MSISESCAGYNNNGIVEPKKYVWNNKGRLDFSIRSLENLRS